MAIITFLSLNIFKELSCFFDISCQGFCNELGNLHELAARSSILGVVLAGLALFVLLALNHWGKHHRFHLPGKTLTTTFILVWLAGFVIYDVGMCINNDFRTLCSNFPMAVLHSFEMFLLQSDVSAVHESFHDNRIFMCAFSLVHILAAFITLVFVIKHFGYNIIAGLRMFFEAFVLRSKRETFVFWGLNDATYLLASDIIDKYQRTGAKDYRIIVVRTNHDSEEAYVRNGMERLFNFLSLRNNDLERLRSLNCLTTSTYTDLTRLSINSENLGDNVDILRKYLDLNQLTTIIANKVSDKLHLFFLSEDDNENIQAVGTLQRDKTLNDLAAQGKSIVFYCKARYNSVHRVIEDDQTNENFMVKVIDPSHICVEMLKEDKLLHPVCYVDVEKDATVSSDFNALVIGFGEVGYDAVRFLYEFGAFVATGSTENDVKQSGFHCDVVDKDIKTLAGLFAVNAPSISLQMLDGDDEESRAPIILHDMDIHGIEFYNLLERLIKKLNYVVIALDDDEKNVSLAVRIFRLAARYREDMEHFRILARVRNDAGNHLLKITEHYNRMWAGEQHPDDDLRLHQCTIERNAPQLKPITLFGSMAETYTWDYIISNHLIDKAKCFKDKYDNSMINKFEPTEYHPDRPLNWEEEQRDLMQQSGKYRGFSPTFSAIMRLRRIQRQNMENCFHEETKRILAKLALGDEKYALLSGQYLTRNENETTYHWQNHDPEPSVERVLEVLAQTEHLRWVASHEILGYRVSDLKNEVRLLHACLKPWNELTPKIKSLDYNVVDVSLGIVHPSENAPTEDRQLPTKN